MLWKMPGLRVDHLDWGFSRQRPRLCGPPEALRFGPTFCSLAILIHGTASEVLSGGGGVRVDGWVGGGSREPFMIAGDAFDHSK